MGIKRAVDAGGDEFPEAEEGGSGVALGEGCTASQGATPAAVGPQAPVPAMSDEWCEVDGSQGSHYEDARSWETGAVVLGKRAAGEREVEVDGPPAKVLRGEEGRWLSG